ncbi:hypothetical protein [Novipirellula sp.]|uniref:hypothetical protein n=1 Tax=Novipirellula sp. TaxID=2795430 RepID=UPI0035696ED1
MTCQEFMATLQHQIDRRQSIDGNDLLQTHASQCECCRERWVAWQQIATVLPGDEPSAENLLAPADAESCLGDSRTRFMPRHVMAAVLLAAAAVILVAFRMPPTPALSPSAESSSAESSIALLAPESISPSSSLTGPSSSHEDRVPKTSLSMLGAENRAYGMRTNPVAWFHDVQQRDWLGQTMPTVESFRDGVAPIGRSLLRAVTILTTSGKDQPS